MDLHVEWAMPLHIGRFKIIEFWPLLSSASFSQIWAASQGGAPAMDLLPVEEPCPGSSLPSELTTGEERGAQCRINME
jgi:hypothetical protein